MTTSKLKILATVAIIAVAAVVVICYAFGDPVGDGYAPRCLLKTITGYDCPGCGFQRALSSILHGDWTSAWHYNPFLFFAIPIGTVYAIVELCPGRLCKMRKILLSVPFTMSLLVSIVLWWVLRNLL